MTTQRDFSGRGSGKRRPGDNTPHRGFTLLEAMLALVIIAVGVLAFVDAQAGFTRTNSWSSRAATGMLLSNEVREFSRRLNRHDPVTGLFLSGTGASQTLHGWGREDGETTVDDIDDLDDLDGVSFGAGGTFPGPVDAFGYLVPQTDLEGNIVLAEGQPVALEGWSQHVTVAKVDPYNFGQARAAAYTQAATSQLPAIGVDQFPLRMTVVVNYTDPGTGQTSEITRTTWIVPP